MFKDTTSFKLISLLEEMSIKNTILNRFKFIYKLMIYKFKQQIRLKILKPNLIDLLKEYFKEYFYLNNIIKSKNLNTSLKNQNMYTNIIGSNYDVIITFISSDIRYSLYISYDSKSDIFKCYIDSTNKNFNITEKNIQSKDIKNIVCEILNIFNDNISSILTELYHYNIENLKNIYKEDN